MVHQLAAKLFDIVCEQRVQPWSVFVDLSEGDSFARVLLDTLVVGVIQQTEDGDLTIVLVKSPLERQVKCSLRDILSAMIGPELSGFKESKMHVACVAHVPID